jgi:hypothetical protein
MTWTTSTDVLADTVTYQLLHKDANDANYSSVATGLTTNEYTLSEAEGTWTYKVVASDEDGGSNTSDASGSVVVDKTGPYAPAGSTSPASPDFTTLGADRWWKDSVAVGFGVNTSSEANGDYDLADGSDGSGFASATASEVFDSSNADPSTGAFSKTGYATDNAGNTETTGTTVSGYVDWKNPTVSLTPDRAAEYVDGSSNNWWKDSVTFSVGASDPAPTSGLKTDPTTTLSAFTSSGSIAAGTYTAEDNVGHTASNAAVSYSVDSAAPTFGTCMGGPFTLGSGMHDVSITASDEVGGSGLKASGNTLTGQVDTSTASAKQVTFTAYDNVGHKSEKTCTYHVVGASFLSPIDKAPMLNIAKLGRVIPVKSIVSVDGTPVGAEGGPIYVAGATQVTCTTGTNIDDIEVYAAGASNTGNLFRWDATGQFWIYNFDTSAFKMQVGNCYRISVYYGGTVTNGTAAGGTLAGYFLMKTTK